MRSVIAAAVFLASLSVSPMQAEAQNGQLIEGLFRTWANSQVDREKQKRKEAEERLRKLEAQRANANRNPDRSPSVRPSTDPYKVQLPSGFGRGPISTPQPNVRPGTVRPTPSGRSSPSGRPSPSLPMPSGARDGRINVRSKSAADYAQQLVAFRADFGNVVTDLKRNAGRNAAIRSLLPSAYQVSATCDTILNRLDGLDSLRPIESSHRALDQQYRKVAHRIRSLNTLSDECGTLVSQCDSACGRMALQLGFQPQFDRYAIDTQLLSAATHMVALEDDLELLEINRGQCRKLQHDCRLMRQQLLAARIEINDMPYEACVERFKRFMSRWNALSVALYELHSPFVSRRLDRIGECADAAYQLLWLDSPTSLADVAGIAHRLHYDLEKISKSLTFFSMSSLSNRQQDQLVAALRDLNRMALDLEKIAENPNAGRELSPLFTRFDQTWLDIQRTLAEVTSIPRGLIAETERGCQQLRELLGVHNDYATPFRFSDLVSVGASLEGTTEYLHRVLNELERFMTPPSYRSSVSRVSASFYRHTREVHELLSRTERLNDPKHLDKLQDEAEHLLEDWNNLVAQLEQMEPHGVPGQRANQVRQLQQQIVPMLGQIAAALVQR